MPILLRKVLIYATYDAKLLVFREPDFPTVPLQVPGGTLEPNETPLSGAKREFMEETGLSGTGRFILLGAKRNHFTKDRQHYEILRFFAHAPIKNRHRLT